MNSILISDYVPNEILKYYKERFSIIMPDAEKKTFSYEEILERIEKVDAYMVLDCVADRRIIDAGKNLEVIASFGVGFNSIDVAYATARGIPVINTPTAPTDAVAEHTIALMLSCMRGITPLNRDIRNNVWPSENFSDRFDSAYGKTLGLLGFGRIGKAVCKKAQGLGMEVIYYDLVRASPEIEDAMNVKYFSFDEVIRKSDVLSLHMPYVATTHHLIDRDVMSSMKENAYFINTARGALVDETALAEALRDKKIKGAGLDVFENEPHIQELLLELDNVVLTPHISSLTMQARLDMCREDLDGISSVLNGVLPPNTVNRKELLNSEA